MKQRSGCGMIARWRPFAEVSAAMPSGEPLGLKGYTSVASPEASVYLQDIQDRFTPASPTVMAQRKVREVHVLSTLCCKRVHLL